MEAQYILEVIIGAGIVGMLWRMSSNLGALTSEMKRTNKVLTDHEGRIRTLEKK